MAPAGTVPLRFVTAASLFDGHDASINIMRRILQSLGAEVIHLGHNRSVGDIVTAAIQEDVHAIAISSYQGGHVEYFKYMIDLLKEGGAGHIRVFGGGGGVIVKEEIEELHAYGVTRIYAPEDGQRLGLQGMIRDMLETANRDLCGEQIESLEALAADDHRALARTLTAIECGRLDDAMRSGLRDAAATKKAVPVLGITGTGGAGKSSLTDELIRRFRLYSEEPRMAVIAIDPSKRKTGGALLGDRIRMNAIQTPNVYFRSMSTRGAVGEVPDMLSDMIAACRAAGFELVIIETPGIGQGDAGIVPYSDVSLYVMTPEFGAASQLEKIDMLDFADAVAINKFDRKGAADALRDVSKQYQRNHELFAEAPDSMPVFGTIASRFADAGVTALYHKLIGEFEQKGFGAWPSAIEPSGLRASEPGTAIVPPSRQWYLG
ncbi:MAG: cobalamin-dependent protein, partial [Geminicoccaceae bacterium]